MSAVPPPVVTTICSIVASMPFRAASFALIASRNEGSPRLTVYFV